MRVVLEDDAAVNLVLLSDLLDEAVVEDGEEKSSWRFTTGLFVTDVSPGVGGVAGDEALADTTDEVVVPRSGVPHTLVTGGRAVTAGLARAVLGAVVLLVLDALVVVRLRSFAGAGDVVGL